MARKNEVVVDTLKKLLQEVVAHNEDYHHVTKKQFIHFAEDLINKLQAKGKRFQKFDGRTGEYKNR